jgi:hypothetical protein
MPAVDLNALRAVVETCATTWTRRPITWRLQHSPAHHDPQSAWLDCETAVAVGRLIVWDDGRAYLEVSYLDTTAVRTAHYELRDPSDLQTWIATLADWISAFQQP